MNRINPFDNLHFKQNFGNIDEINSPLKVNEQNQPKEAENAQSVGSIPQTSEDDFIDTSAMVDDTDNFNSSDFNFENNEDNNKAGEINSNKTDNNDNSQNQNNQNEDDIQKQVNEFIKDLLEKQTNN